MGLDWTWVEPIEGETAMTRFLLAVLISAGTANFDDATAAAAGSAGVTSEQGTSPRSCSADAPDATGRARSRRSRF